MSDDLIKRSDAIRAVAQDLMYEACVQSEYASDELSDWIEVAKVMLEDVPSAGRPQGKWIDMGDFEQCSVCKGTHLKEFQSYYGKVTWIKTPYCPNCGAKMKGADDE